MAKKRNDEILENKVSKIFTKKPLPHLAEVKSTDPKAGLKKPAKVVIKPEAKKELGQANKDVVVQKVISTRELKYIYPKNCNTATGRKAYRATVRGKIKSLESAISKLKGAERVTAKESLSDYLKLHMA